MQTPICRTFGIEFPIFAFSHCRDVVAAVSRAGGFGVLGAVGFPPEQLEVELRWIDEHVGDRPYGVDIVIPGKYEGMGEVDPAKLEAMLLAAVPEEHRRFADRVLSDHGVPRLPGGPDVQALESLARQHRPKLFILNTVVHNPTGLSLSVGVAHDVLRIAQQHDFLLVDQY